MEKSRKVLVVNPYVHDFKLYDEWMHPVGLYYLIDMLKTNGWEVYYFDCLERSPGVATKKFGTSSLISREIDRPDCYRNLRRRYKCYGCSEERLLQYLTSLSGIEHIFVGSMMTYWAYGVLETVRHIRKVFPTTPLVCGGIAVRLIPEFFRDKIKNVHFFTESLSGVKGRCILPGFNEPLRVPEQSSIRSAFTYAVPMSHGPIVLSLGCPMHCSYCASNILQPKYQRRSIVHAITELKSLVNDYKVRDFAFYDDALLLDADSLLIPFLKCIINDGLSVRLHTPNGLHLKYISRPLLELMRKAGFTTLRFGYESGSFKYRHLTGSKVDIALLDEKMRLLNEWKFPDTGVYVMGGLPGSSPAEMAVEMEHIASFGIKVKPVFLSPVPRTPLFQIYLPRFPQLANDPLWHNDTFFITQLEKWGSEGVEKIRALARELNCT